MSALIDDTVREIVDVYESLKEDGVRDALVSAGWTPPPLSTEKQRSDLTGRPVTEWEAAGWTYLDGFEYEESAKALIEDLGSNLQYASDVGPGECLKCRDWYRVFTRPKECCGTPSACQSPPCPEADTVNMQYQGVDIEFDKQFSGIACPPPSVTYRPNRRSITGSIRDNREGKGRYDLESPISRRILVEALEKGADKYEAHNWSLGQPVSWYYDSASRHLTNWWASGDTGDLHAAFVNLHMLVHTDEMLRRRRLPEELDDRPDYDAEVRPE